MTNAIAAWIVATTGIYCTASYDLSTPDPIIVASCFNISIADSNLMIPSNCVTVTVLTNVVKWSNESGCPMYGQPHYFYLGTGQQDLSHFEKCRPYVPETERTETTIVMERRVLRFKWLDVWREIVSEKELSRTVKRWKLKEQWEAVP